MLVAGAGTVTSRQDRAAHQVDMLAKRVAFARGARRQPDVRGGVIDPAQVREPTFDRQVTLSTLDVALEQRELTVPAIDAGPGTPPQAVRQPVDEGHDEEQHRDEKDEESF